MNQVIKVHEILGHISLQLTSKIHVKNRSHLNLMNILKNYYMDGLLLI